jgi:hypothetical protein
MTTTPNIATPKRYWLRKKGTLSVFQRTALLAKRDDMEAITEEQALDLIKQQEAANVRMAAKRREALNMDAPPNATADVETPEAKEQALLVEEGAVPPPRDPNAEVPLEEMDITELREIAAGLKIAVGDNWGTKAIITHIKKARAEDAKEAGQA